MSDEWKKKALCHDLTTKDPSLATAWITEAGPNLEKATEVCLGCEVRMWCLRAAIDDPSSFGMRGGYFFVKGRLTSKDAARLRKELGIEAPVRQRPRKPRLKPVAQLA